MICHDAAVLVTLAEHKKLAEGIVYYDDKHGDGPFCDVFADQKLFNEDEQENFLDNKREKARGKEGEKLPCHRFCSGNTVSEHKMSVHHIRDITAPTKAIAFAIR